MTMAMKMWKEKPASKNLYKKLIRLPVALQ